jgi:hypothetical protein
MLCVNVADRYVLKRMFHLIRTEWFNCVKPMYLVSIFWMGMGVLVAFGSGSGGLCELSLMNVTVAIVSVCISFRLS